MLGLQKVCSSFLNPPLTQHQLEFIHPLFFTFF